MGKRRKSKEWRRFEETVSHLEAALGPEGYSLKSPDHLIDGDTGDLREVDCSVRDASAVVVASIECRRRRKREDVIWIEQLACKKESLALPRTVAVSSSGFSRSAHIKAAKRGIDLRTLREIVDPAILADFRSVVVIKQFSRENVLVNFRFTLERDEPLPDGLYERFAETIHRLGGEAIVLTNTINSRDVRLGELANECSSRAQGLSHGSNLRTFELTFAPETIALGSVPTVVFLSSVKLELDIRFDSRALENVQLHQYSAGGNVLLELASADATVPKHGSVTFNVAFRRT